MVLRRHLVGPRRAAWLCCSAQEQARRCRYLVGPRGLPRLRYPAREARLHRYLVGPRCPALLRHSASERMGLRRRPIYRGHRAWGCRQGRMLMTARWLLRPTGWVPRASRARRYPRSPHPTRPTARHRTTAASATMLQELAASVRSPPLLSQPNHFPMARRIPGIRSAPTRREPVELEQPPSRRCLPKHRDPRSRLARRVCRVARVCRSRWLDQGGWGRWIPTSRALTMRGTAGSRQPRLPSRRPRLPRSWPVPTGCGSQWPDRGARARSVRRGWARWVSGLRVRLGAGRLPLRRGGRDFVPGSSRRSGRTPNNPSVGRNS